MAGADARCLDENTVILLAEGALAGHALERAEEHLSQCASCRELLAESVRDAEYALADPAATHATPPLSQPRVTPTSLPEGELEVPLPGTVLIDKYQVESVLGSGGMGVVLAATHLVLGSRVAIKVLRRPGPSEVARFLREARVSAQIRNRHIARVFDFGQLPNGAPFLVMEYLEGRDLAQCIEPGPLPVPLAVEYVLQACEALAQVHALGIVHRDLKPANLFLTEDHGQPVIKVLDFGIFKSIAGAVLDVGLVSTRLTGAHALIGSPVYMSPEQMRGDEVDARSDVWALGVILYEMLTTELPFGQTTLSALAMAVATEQPTPPSRLSPEIPRQLEQVILRCLRKQPDERYDDAGALRAALLSLRDRAQTSQPQSRRWFVLAVLTVGVVGALWWWSSERTAPRALDSARPALREITQAPTVSQSVSPLAGRDASALTPAAPLVAEDQAREVDAASGSEGDGERRPQAKPPRPRPSQAVRARSKPAKPSAAPLGPTDTPD